MKPGSSGTVVVVVDVVSELPVDEIEVVDVAAPVDEIEVADIAAPMDEIEVADIAAPVDETEVADIAAPVDELEVADIAAPGKAADRPDADGARHSTNSEAPKKKMTLVIHTMQNEEP